MKPVEVSGLTLDPRVGIGIAVFPVHASDADAPMLRYLDCIIGVRMWQQQGELRFSHPSQRFTLLDGLRQTSAKFHQQTFGHA